MPRVTRFARRVLCASAFSTSLAGCGGSTDDGGGGPQPSSITVAAGNLQSARFSTPVPLAPSVLVVGSTGPLAGVTVTFSVTLGGGTAQGTSAVTNASGVAAVGSWTLGPTPGNNTLRASAGSVSVDIIAIGTSGPPAALVVEAGDNQNWVERSNVPVRPAVKVTDGTFGVPGVQVVFAVASGAGTVAIPQVTTNSAGVATVGGWRLGDVGVNTLTATVSGIASPLTFTANAAVLQITALNNVSGDGQTGFMGNFSGQQVIAEVQNQFNQPAEGVTVTFAVTGGGGTLAGTVDTTGANGRATLGSWRFGSGAQQVTATAGTATAAFNATTNPVPASQFGIEVRYLGTPPDAAVQTALTDAATRWAQIIVGDLPDIVLSGTTTLPEFQLNTGITGVGTITCIPTVANQTLDDMVIFADIRPIDGTSGSNILGFATPVYGRQGDLTTIAGCMVFDEANLADLQSAGRLQDVVLHEMGHIIGIGSNWKGKSLLVGGCPVGALTPYFTGGAARNAFVASLTAVFSDSIVPVEGNGACNGNNGDGTRDSHWSEAALNAELMTGFVELSVPNPLSAITAGSVRDLGYLVNDAASDAYSLLRSPGAFRTFGRKLKLNEVEVRAPRIVVDAHGNVVGTR